ncbi:retrotransposon hot spot (RHS) protein, putative [Trypanosoma brucei brucei TREU927]|uniref:Retrotransposon hot spot (RHS) protein, putative n=1 Tax=Trypanosoma brucei brucei (strain 927/4 GUTat10.1) TaxID=185431 RepID=Q57UV0_TRYB2|nr:retrotransposon hot spot (RHS) protein, putative [Trypanosoma brucei brucei TREU927]AAX70627.1 retrotransposon hot spot (RHS) protein, putative [Trypanosoma brucei]AAZ10616.1 retrotransposon hot spot (RHS) protein, putative [Trypanosoma brucei brucei TREU927]
MNQNGGSVGDTRNVLNGWLNGAYRPMKRQASRENENPSETGEGKSLEEKLYDSTYNAKWSYIIIDDGTQPLGMTLVDGMPNEGLMWKDEELNVVPKIEETLEQKPERTEGVELLVLTSEMGWPYTGFARGSNSDIFIRREELRVWNVVRSGIELWRTQRVIPGCLYLPRSYVAIGNPGIGKSQNLGSFILYKLLHYDAEELPVVAYFRGVAAYIFEKSDNGGVGRVREYSKEAAITFMKVISSNTRGYIIYDFVNKGEQPPADVAPKWGSILISSPNLRNFDSWQKQRKGAFIVVNCWEMSEMRAFFSRMGLKLFPQATHVELREKWNMYENRVERVGPSLRYVFDEVMYGQELTAVDGELGSIVAGNKYGIYTKVLDNCGEWRDNDASHKLVKIVRIKAREGNSFDTYVCVAHSESIKKRILNVVFSGIAEEWALTTGMMRNASAIGLYFEENAIKYLCSPRVLTCFVSLITKLPANERARRMRTRKSILQHVRDDLLKVGRTNTVPGDINWAESEGAPVELYVPCIPNYPVADAFFIVDDKEAAQASGTTGKKTIVLLQFTVASRHDTKTDEFIHLLQSLLPSAEGGGHQNEATVEQLEEITEMFHWEIIYVQHFESTAMRSEQKCEITQGKAKHRSHQFVKGFWKNNVQQYHVQYEDNIVIKMLAVAAAGRR